MEYGEKLDEKQKEAVFLITQQVHSTFILSGFSKTGKTSTLVAAILRLLCKKRKKILVCAPTNMIADTFAKKLMKFVDHNKILRLISPSRDTTKIDKELSEVTEKPRTNAGYLDHDTSENLTAEQFQRFPVVICTLRFVPTMTKKYNLSNRHFSHIFIDEAGQCPEMDCWLPLHFLASENTKLILAGHPKKTTNIMEIDCLEQYGYKKSLFARLYEHSHFVPG